MVGSVGFVFFLHKEFELTLSIAQTLDSFVDLFFDIRVEIDPHYVWDIVEQTNLLIIGLEYSFKAVVMSAWNGEGDVDVEFVAFGDDFLELIDEVEGITELRGWTSESEEWVDDFLPFSVLHDGGTGSFPEIDWHWVGLGLN